MFFTRLISGIVLLALLIAVIVTGGNVLLIFTAVISMIGLFELYRAVKMEKTIPAVLGYLAGITFEIFLFLNYGQHMMTLFLVFFLLLMVSYVLLYPKYVFDQITNVFLGFFYVVVMLSYIYQVRMAEEGQYLVWLIIISAWGSDTFAYCAGRLFGKHKLPSPLSPKKTIEGCVGGVIGAGLLGLVYAVVFKEQITADSNVQIVFPIACAVGSVIAQIGDLCASAVKRNHEIKDYGKLIPGHGGIMDRFDSVIFTAPVVYLLLTYLG